MNHTRKTLLWLQTGACGGDSLALLEARSPSLEQLLAEFDIELLWHPSLSHAPTRAFDDLVAAIERGERVLDLLCVEGSVVMAPHGTGLYDTHRGRAKKDMLAALAERAGAVLAMGTCAAFGGVHAAPPNPGDCTGLQYRQAQPGGLLPPDWRSAWGLPVINISGCPAHPHAMTQTLAWLAQGLPLALDGLNRPHSHFNSVVHQGCTRNEYHEYDIEGTEFGGPACMFFNLGCQGPMTQAVCNVDLWNGVSSKTRAGVPCFGCTAPNFPQDRSLFETEKVGPIPLTLPLGVERPRYMAYKNLARAASPQRVRDKKMDV